jgi:hypothetical protein
MITLNTFFIFFVIILSICMIGYGVRNVYRYLYVGYHVLVSDTPTPYLSLKFIGHTDELEVHTLTSGKQMYHTVIQAGYSVVSATYDLPTKHANPYDYIMSGELDAKIKSTRLLTDYMVVTDNLANKNVEQPNLVHLENLPIKFHDVSDEVRRKLGIHIRE